MLTFTFPANKIKAALPFAAVKDIRYYLNGCLFTAHAAGVAIVATDGHRLSVVYDRQDSAPAELEFIVHSDDLVRALKAHGRSQLDMVFQVLPAPEKESARIVRILTAGGATVIECREIEGKFPDWKKVIPGMAGCYTSRTKWRDAPHSSGLNPAYLGDYAKAAAAFGLKVPCIRMRQSHFGASMLILVAGAPDFLSVLMPAREDPPELPEWANGTPAAAKPQAFSGVMEATPIETPAEPEELRHAA